MRASHKNSKSKLKICWNDASKFSSISSVSWLFVEFQDLTGPDRVVPPPASPVPVQLCCHEATRHGDSALSLIIYCFFSLKPASTVFPPNCHLNFQFGVKKCWWDSRSVFTLGACSLKWVFFFLRPPNRQIDERSTWFMIVNFGLSDNLKTFSHCFGSAGAFGLVPIKALPINLSSSDFCVRIHKIITVHEHWFAKHTLRKTSFLKSNNFS
jgi:hypothetical protein